MIAVSAPQMARPSSRVIGDARGHQQAADIGVAEAERAVLVGELGDLPCDGNCAIITEISSTTVHSRHGVLEGLDVEACRRASRNGSRLSEARLQAVSSRNMYSEHGFDARIGPAAGQVCQSLMVVLNWRPGSAEAQAA